MMQPVAAERDGRPLQGRMKIDGIPAPVFSAFFSQTITIQ
jgi:hypothetical protein